MASDLNLVETTVVVAGKKIHFFSLSLFQKFNSHHHFEIVVDYEEMDEKWMESASNIIGLIGETVNITMKHRQTGEENLFEGIIVKTSLSGYHGQKNSVIITGKSPTIKLDGKETMDSFMDKTLQQIVDEAVANSGNGGSVTSQPVFSGLLDYSVQHNQTCFDFINSLSWLYGEWFYYNGTETFFGKPDAGGVTDITYDVEMTTFDLSANLVPPKYNRYYYLHHDDKETDQDAPEMVSGVQGYLQKSLNMSNKVYTSEANLPLNPIIRTKKEIEDLMEVEKTRSVGNMLIMSGNTQTCKIKIGEKVKIKFPTTMEVGKKEVDVFTITEVTHTVDQKGHYSNSFKGILSELNNIPMDPCPAPIAGSQLAWVKSNADPKSRGRVQVQLQWQKKENKSTNWIRVQTPDAGKSDDVSNNRGFVHIPEEGDIVMVGFEYGDPDRPFVAGSVFSETVSIGGGADNNIKTIITRSGHTIKFDDTKGKEKIQVYDIKGNIVEIDTVENTINVSANSTINMSAVNINLLAKNAITANAGVTFLANAGATSSITGGVSTFINAGKEAAIKAGKTLSAKGGKNALISSGLNSQMTLDSKGNATLKGKKKVDINSKEKVKIAGDKQTLMQSKDMKIQGKTSTSIKGRKVDIG